MRTVKHKVSKMVPLGGYALPQEFELEISNEEDDAPDVALRFRVKAGRVECSEVVIRAKDDGREVQTQDLRALRILDLQEEAVQWAAAPITSRDENGVVGITYSPDRVHDRGPVREMHKARRRLRVTPERLREVADLVRSSTDPTSAIMDALDVGQRAAQLWIKRAKDGIDPQTDRPYLENGA